MSGPGPDLPPPASRRAAWPFAAGLSVLVALCWIFPQLWYSRPAKDQPVFWLAEATNAPGWRFRAEAVDKSAEAMLAADRLFYGEFSRASGETVRLFTASRYTDNTHELGLFVHTPDRCWTEVGWHIEPVEPDHITMPLGGGTLGMERRVFVHPSGVRELVLFFGLVGGQSLPYRLDHNLGVGLRFRTRQETAQQGGRLRAVDGLFWRRLWDSFVSRRPLLGPKEFVRISTTVVGGDVGAADALLSAALPQLLEVRQLHVATRPVAVSGRNP